MSILPLNSGVSQPSSASGHEPLTVSQALTITAGMAGLIGLVSGMIIRFSLANSAHARFLSPLQTFPALSSGTPQQPPGSPLIRDLPSERLPYAQDVYPKTSPSQRQETLLAPPMLEAADSTEGDFVAPRTFDVFADRSAPSRRVNDPWEALRAGPKLGEITNPSEAEVDYFIDGF